MDPNAIGGSLRVNHALSDSKLTATKTKRRRRRIDLSAGSVAALKAHRKRQLEERTWFDVLRDKRARALGEIMRNTGAYRCRSK